MGRQRSSLLSIQFRKASILRSTVGPVPPKLAISQPALLVLTDCSQVDMLGVLYTSVDFAAGKRPGSPNQRAQKDGHSKILDISSIPVSLLLKSLARGVLAW